VKFLSRLLTALNLLPSMATLAFVSRPISRQSATNCAHTLRIAGPLSVDKDVDHANRIILANPILQALRKQRVLPAIRALNKALHLIPSQIARESYCENHIDQRVFTQPGSQSVIRRCRLNVRIAPESGRIADIGGCRRKTHSGQRED
jgi:hypothetical protein